MRQTLTHIARLMAVVAVASTVASAQETGYSAAFKLRVGNSLTSKDNLSKKVLGFGLEVGYTQSWGRVAAELGYQYKPGDQRMVDFSTMDVAPGALPPNGNPSAGLSSDVRKNSLEGVTLRLSFEKAIPGTDFAWHAGVQLGGAKFRHEYIADIAPNSSYTYEDTYNGTPTKSVLAPSPFVGMTYAVSPSSSVEVNLIAISYTAIFYNHVAGATPTASNAFPLDTLKENKRVVPTIEVGYTFRF